MNTSVQELELPMFAVEPPDAASEADAICRIDAMDYEEMLRMVRCSPLDDPLFRGDVGRHFHATMRTRRHGLAPEVRAKISQQVGW